MPRSRMTLRQEMLNGFGMAHGGMIFAFGDTAFALACNPATRVRPKSTITVASGVDINFLKPAFRGQVLLTAVANRRASTGRSGLYDIQIYAADPGAGAPGRRTRHPPARLPPLRSRANSPPTSPPAPRGGTHRRVPRPQPHHLQEIETGNHR